MPLFFRSSSFSRVTALAAQRPVHEAFAWLHGNPKTIMDWQAGLVVIPAPPFGEQARSDWLAAKFAEAGLTDVQTDAVGNVYGTLAAVKLPPESSGPVVVLSAHLDTVFPAETPLHPVMDGDRLQAPGSCDNGAGVAGMLAIARALVEAKITLPAPLIFLGNVGEEGEGDLRGVRHFYNQRSLAGRVAAHIVLDGAGADSAVTRALGSRRYQVTINGPGGHSFTDAGTANPIAALATALATLAEVSLPEEPRTTLNMGIITTRHHQNRQGFRCRVQRAEASKRSLRIGSNYRGREARWMDGFDRGQPARGLVAAEGDGLRKTLQHTHPGGLNFAPATGFDVFDTRQCHATPLSQ